MLNLSERKHFATTMIGIGQNYGVQLEPHFLEFMLKALGNYTMAQIEAAALQIVRTRKYTTMPTIADFVEAIEGSADDKASVQALLVWDAIRRHGVYACPVFEDPVTNRVVSQLGWKSICATPDSDRSWFLRNMAAAYKAHRKCDEVKAISGPTAVGGLIQGVVKSIGTNTPTAMHG
ncbi:hypothetical protein [Desulfoluna spongiiphila]|uniref:Uncharacterized protein n=1 Tax=Desulfoluna spongiiphila TaxID=419481 RepID=A0A1G5G4N5_9BACT|nr:hypothetical protein [Desulfoluna spongiiphila]SCY46279.1 hypothetical protein SAMN05216233_109206 [Desulfoluna spongiiphila]